MNLNELVIYATDKERFQTLENYTDFCIRYLEYIEKENGNG